MTQPLASFGRIFEPAAHSVSPDEAVRRLKSGMAGKGRLLAYGNGRSYGDSCLNSDGALVDMRGRSRVAYFDEADGVLAAEAGILLTDIIALAIPRGLFPPVVPGTRYVTLGGAIANDIHGKNHHRFGTFGNHVVWLDLLRSDGKVYRCSPHENASLFAATVGGMGLTGLILTAAIRLRRVSSPNVIEKRLPFASVADYLDMAEEADAANEYAVAWIDQAGGGATGRGVLLCANHAGPDADVAASGDAKPLLGIPFDLPFTVLSGPFVRAFNAAYGWSKRRPALGKASNWRGYFFPLDGIGDWNRLYGPRGLYQHQSVVPADAAREALPALLAAADRAAQASFLTVLKRFGSIRSPGLLSFPRPGYTLTLDFPNRGARTLRLLEELDAIVIGSGGAVNPYKDARMPASVFDASFPDWRELERLRDPAFVSDFWRRTALKLEIGSNSHPLAAE